MASHNLHDCEQVRALIGPDDEPHVSTSEVRDAYSHVKTCEACHRFFEHQKATVSRVKQISQSQTAPPHLRERVLAAIDQEQLATPVRRLPRLFPWPAMGGLAAAAAVLAIFIGVWQPNPSADLMGPTVAAAMQTAPTSDSMSTSESESLREWFGSHSVPDFEIPVIANAQLTGGRVIQVAGRAAAAVEFIKDGRSLTYVMAPVSEWLDELTAADILSVNSRGYEVAIWEEDGTARAVLSSMPRGQLRNIAEQCKYKSIL